MRRVLEFWNLLRIVILSEAKDLLSPTAARTTLAH